MKTDAAGLALSALADAAANAKAAPLGEVADQLLQNKFSSASSSTTAI
jgi:hypothetical protein